MDGTFDKAEARAYLDNVKKHVSVEVDKVWPSIEEFILEGGGRSSKMKCAKQQQVRFWNLFKAPRRTTVYHLAMSWTVL